MPNPCKECPFRRDYEKRSPSEMVVVFVGEVCRDEGQLCHMRDDGADCEGARRFFEGGHDDVFGSCVEFALARGKDPLAAEFFAQVERLMAAEGE